MYTEYTYEEGKYYIPETHKDIDPAGLNCPAKSPFPPHYHCSMDIHSTDTTHKAGTLTVYWKEWDNDRTTDEKPA